MKQPFSRFEVLERVFVSARELLTRYSVDVHRAEWYLQVLGIQVLPLDEPFLHPQGIPNLSQ